MRQVIVSKREWQPRPEPQKGNMLVLVEKGIATFLAFGIDYEELNSGAGSFSTAIVEYEDGTVDNIPVGDIRFIKEVAP